MTDPTPEEPHDAVSLPDPAHDAVSLPNAPSVTPTDVKPEPHEPERRQQPVEVVVNLNTAPHPTKPADQPKVDPDVEVKLIEAKRPFWDRLITSGLLPIALLIVGPACTYYFASRANEGLTAVNRSNTEVSELKQVVTDLSNTLQRADRRLKEMDEERAAELRAMHALSERLDRTVQSALIQMAVFRIMGERRVGLLGPSGSLPSSPVRPGRAEVLRAVMEQVALPGLDRDEVFQMAESAYDRINLGELATQPERVWPTMPDQPNPEGTPR